MIWNVISWCVFGLIAGLIARAVTPGAQPLGCLATIGVGVAGAFLSGLVVHLLFGRGAVGGVEPAGFIGAVVGGIVVLMILHRLRGRPVG